MTEFVKKLKDKRAIDFSDLDINQPLVFDGGDGTVYIKNNDRHATSLETNLTSLVDLDDQCIPVEITKVEYEEGKYD